MRSIFRGQPVDPGRAQIISAVIGVAGMVIGAVATWLVTPDYQSRIDQKDDQIKTLQTDLRTAQAPLAACLQEKAGAEARLTSQTGLRTAAETRAENCETRAAAFDGERDQWMIERGDLETELQNVGFERQRAVDEAGRLQAESKRLRTRIALLEARLARNLELGRVYENVTYRVKALTEIASEYGDDASFDALQALARQTRDALREVEDFRQDYEEVQYYFNAEMKDLLDRLEEGAVPEAGVIQRRLQEALDGLFEREERFSEELDQLLDAARTLDTF